MKKNRIQYENIELRQSINMQRERSFDSLFKEFNLHCKARNLSETTLEYYYFCWQPFKGFLEKEEIGLSDINTTIFIRVICIITLTNLTH